MERFLGGSPLSVLIRLIFISLLVGAVMAFLGLSPQALYDSIVRFMRSITGLGFGAKRLRPWFAAARTWRILDGVIAVVMIVLGISLLMR